MEPGFSYGPSTTTRTTLVVVLALCLTAGHSGRRRSLGVERRLRERSDAGVRVVMYARAASLPASEIYRRAVDGVVKIVAFDVRDGGYARRLATPGAASWSRATGGS